MNLCMSCGKDFAGANSFDAHRVGRHSYTYSEGVKMEPIREDGRRCLSVEEIEALGYEKNDQDRWFHAASAKQVRESFAAASLA